MKSSNYTTNERGLTLVEILAALVILGIVFVGFMTVFPQMTNFNEKTETKLETMNEARTVLANFKQKEPYSSSFFADSDAFTKDSNDFWLKSNNGEVVKVYKNPVMSPTGDNLEEKQNQYFLHKVEISIFSGNKEVSKTFGLVQVRNQ